MHKGRFYNANFGDDDDPRFSMPKVWMEATTDGGHVDLVITYDSTGLPPGTYEGTLLVTSNDADEGAVAIPVQLVVGGPTAAESYLPLVFAFGLRGRNPARAFQVLVALPYRTEAELDVFDVRGTLVRRMLRGPRPAGYHALEWDGRDDRGRAAAAGVYFMRLRAASYARTVKVTLMR